MKILLALGLSLLLTVSCFAQTYEKEDDKTVKITTSVAESLSIYSIKEEIISLRQQLAIVKKDVVYYQDKISALFDLLDEAKKVGIDIDSLGANVEK